MEKMRRLGIAFACCAGFGSASAATVNVAVRDFNFSPNDITIAPGDTVHWMNQSGSHNVVDDNGAYSSGSIKSGSWTFDHTFSTAGVYRYYCAAHSAPGQNINTAMNGRITVVQPAPTFAINQGISGSWYDPSKPGQGFLIDVRPSDNFMFVAWFTYEVETPGAAAEPKVGSSDQRWLTAQGNYTGAGGQLALFNTTGGAFNGANATTTTQVGTLSVSFTSCTAGTFSFTLPNNVTGQIPVQRLIPGTETLCQSQSGVVASASADH